MPDKPTTPPNSGPHISIQSTPPSDGVGSLSKLVPRTRDNLQLALQSDVARAFEIPISSFLEHILQQAPNSLEPGLVEKIIADKVTQAWIKSYKRSAAAGGGKTTRYDPFVNLGNHIIDMAAKGLNGKGKLSLEEKDRLPVFHRHDKYPIRVDQPHHRRNPSAEETAEDALRKPDIVLVPKKTSVSAIAQYGSDYPRFFWPDLFSTFEFKLKVANLTDDISLFIRGGEKAYKFKDVDLQTASYATEALNFNGLRKHFINVTISDKFIRLWYFDRVGIIKSQESDFINNPAVLIKVLMAMMRLNNHDWGYHDIFTFPSRIPNNPTAALARAANSLPAAETPTTLIGATVHVNGLLVTFTKTLLTPYALVGRASIVTQGSRGSEDPDLKGKVVVVKVSWPSVRRTPEEVLVQKARDRAKELKSEHINHLPIIHASEDYYSTEGRGPWLALKGIERIANLTLEHRVLRSLVMDELTPITNLKTAEEFRKAIIDIAKCLHWLFEEVKLQHRDVSVANLMYRTVNKELHGVLNDYDLSIMRDKDSRREPTSNQFTGTLPFMAVDLLEYSNSAHLHRHDLESLYYCMVWITARYDRGLISKPQALADWTLASISKMNALKRAFLIIPAGKKRPDGPTKTFEPLDGSLLMLKAMFMKGYAFGSFFTHDTFTADVFKAPSEQSFDHTTLGGYVTWEAFLNCLEM